MQVIIKNKEGKVYEFSDPYGSNNFIDFEFDKEFYMHYDGHERCDVYTGCGQIVGGTNADQK